MRRHRLAFPLKSGRIKAMSGLSYDLPDGVAPDPMRRSHLQSRPRLETFLAEDPTYMPTDGIGTFLWSPT